MELKLKVNLSDVAATKFKEILEKEKKQGLKISVKPGGCSGFMYDFGFADNASDSEISIEEKGIKIFVTKESVKMFNNSSIDFVETEQGAGFQISNPNAKSDGCGCGNDGC